MLLLICIECWCQLIERRTKDSPTFDVPFSAYNHSFGDHSHPRMDFWLGSEQIQHITRGRRFQIRFEMSLSGGLRKVVEFGGFTLDLTQGREMIRMSMYSGGFFTHYIYSIKQNYLEKRYRYVLFTFVLLDLHFSM